MIQYVMAEDSICIACHFIQLMNRFILIYLQTQRAIRQHGPHMP